MQRPGWDPADAPSPPAGPPWASPPADAPARVPAGSGSTAAGGPAPDPDPARVARPAPDRAGPTAPPPAAPPPAAPYAGGPYPGGPYAGGPYPEGDPAGPHSSAPHSSAPYPPAPYPPGAYGDPGAFGPWPPRPPQRPTWPPTRRELTAALAAVAGLALLGAALALLWVRLAPRLEYRVVQPGRAVPVVPAAEEYVAADGRFVLVTLAAGVLAGLVWWLLRGTRGPVVLTALALGGLLGAVVTWRLGIWLAPGYSPQDLQEVGRTVTEPLQLRARAALVVEPVAAVLVYLLGAGFTAHNDLGVDPPAARPEPSPQPPPVS